MPSINLLQVDWILAVLNGLLIPGNLSYFLEISFYISHISFFSGHIYLCVNIFSSFIYLCTQYRSPSVNGRLDLTAFPLFRETFIYLWSFAHKIPCHLKLHNITIIVQIIRYITWMLACRCEASNQSLSILLFIYPTSSPLHNCWYNHLHLSLCLPMYLSLCWLGYLSVTFPLFTRLCRPT